jgi:hypothetical protein
MVGRSCKQLCVRRREMIAELKTFRESRMLKEPVHWEGEKKKDNLTKQQSCKHLVTFLHPSLKKKTLLFRRNKYLYMLMYGCFV